MNANVVNFNPVVSDIETGVQIHQMDSRELEKQERLAVGFFDFRFMFLFFLIMDIVFAKITSYYHDDTILSISLQLYHIISFPLCSFSATIFVFRMRYLMEFKLIWFALVIGWIVVGYLIIMDLVINKNGFDFVNVLIWFVLFLKMCVTATSFFQFLFIR